MHKVSLGTACLLFSILSLHAQSPLKKDCKASTVLPQKQSWNFWPMMNCKDVKQVCTVREWRPAISYPV